MLTAYASVDSATEAVRPGRLRLPHQAGADQRHRRVVHNATEKARLKRENRDLLDRLTEANRQLRQHIGHVEKINQLTDRLNRRTARLRRGSGSPTASSN